MRMSSYISTISTKHTTSKWEKLISDACGVISAIVGIVAGISEAFNLGIFANLGSNTIKIGATIIVVAAVAIQISFALDKKSDLETALNSVRAANGRLQ
jgi:hypothetical protein